MLSTYKGILRGNRIEWDEAVPDELIRDQAVRVYVTILDEPAIRQHPTHQGEQMAAVLEQLAAGNALAEVADPAAWEREVRQDRPLPGRNMEC